ncbi:MAG: hypothetical protein A2091_07425 [Desulfuromonadales bacterium GWD2_61_12]|nr:MAG: hypothetical protein A2005_08015 [Desulfuromonadales bacterium GWC2_61_20]OGR36733.1 MAG: hypothetical protein A2091_07425 [Desulfuromonadales bacterium GWD2_61_12]HAD03506.1 hypothetical protein [Desulfuromonas sp.]HBT83776.1 hypothetical protein [Desulfuromonas sp.]
MKISAALHSPATIKLLFVAAGIGLTTSALTHLLHAPVLDPLLFSLLLGILLRALLKDRINPTDAATRVGHGLILPGIICYAVANLEFTTVASLPPRSLLLLAIVVAICFGTIFLLGRHLGQTREITSLVATGSAICGASAIAITAPAVRARSEDVSISLLAVTMSALVALFVVLPFCGALLRMVPADYALLSGSLLQFTGFVKEAMAQFHFQGGGAGMVDATRLAMLVKATRYLALIVCIPLVASLAHGRLTLPLSLWLYLGAGIGGTLFHATYPLAYATYLLPFAQLGYQLLWSVTMAAIGLSADVRDLLSVNGYRAFWMALAGFVAALLSFLLFWWLFFPNGA